MVTERMHFLVVAIGVSVCACGAVAVAADLPGTGADAGKTVIYRDTWGVPHIYAPTVEAGLYAQGWAQAEDFFPQREGSAETHVQCQAWALSHLSQVMFRDQDPLRSVRS